MTIEVIPLNTTAEKDLFHRGEVLLITAAHFIHDTYTATIAPLLPVLIEKLSLSLTQVGFLSAFLQAPAVLNPFIGYLADRVSVRYFVIFAPAVTATAISLIGFAPNYAMLAILFFCAGVSTAAFHAPAPALVSRASGKRVGLGMSLLMAGGELSFAIGPLLAVWVVSTWTLEGFWRIIVFGWAASLMLYLRLRRVTARPEKPEDLRLAIAAMKKLFLPIVLISLLRYPLIECLTTFLPTYMKGKGANLWVAGASLSIVEFAAIPGVLLSGVISDRLGRKQVLLVSSSICALLMLLFSNLEGGLAVPVLAAMGFFGLSTTPVFLAIVQEQFPNHRATANGIYMAIVFLLRPLGTLAVGFLGDHIGLHSTFIWSALISLPAALAILLLPERKRL